MNTMIVLYDAQCNVCTRLAAFGEKYGKGKLSFLPFQEYAATPQGKEQLGELAHHPPSDLIVLCEGEVLLGEKAWTFLLHKHPTLHTFSWIAQRMGWETGLARSFHKGGKMLRSLCRSCR